MSNKTILLGVIAVTLLSTVGTAFAATPNWNITGTWNFDFNLGGSHYLHTMTVTNFDPITGAFSGTGVYVPDSSYTWKVTGVVSGDTISFTIVYDSTSPNPGYTVTGTGTITSATSMSGTATGPGQEFTWTATGTATQDFDHDGVANSQDLCPGTAKDVPTEKLNVNRWIWDGSNFVTNSPKGKGPQLSFSMDQTQGCSCTQILDWLHTNYPAQYGDMNGQYKFGCSISIMQDFIKLTSPKTFTAADSLYYNGPTDSAPLYGTGAFSFTWNPITGAVTGGYYNEIVPPVSGTTYDNIVSGGSVVGNAVSLTFTRTVPNNYAFSFTGTLTGNTLTGQLDGPYLFTATGAVTQ